MKYSVKSGSLGKLRTDCVVVSLAQVKALAKELKVTTATNLALADFSDKPGKTASLVLTKTIKRALVVGGASGKTSTGDFRKMLTAASAALVSMPGKNAVWALGGLKLDGKAPDIGWQTRNALSILSTAFYSFDAQKKDAPKPDIKSIGAVSYTHLTLPTILLV